MPIPFVEECEQALSGAYSARTRIREAIQKILDYADSDPWQGSQATIWMTDMEGFTGDAKTSLADPFDTAAAECRAEARRLQTESAQNSVG